MLGLRLDLRVSVTLGTESAGSAPGGGAGVSMDLGGSGWGGCESLGRVY